MKKILLMLVLFVVTSMFSQQKYQSLLWKISGKNLKKESYIYGTMHVSSKVAFRLDDIFYKSLYKSEMVALESDPTTWLANSYDLLGEMSSIYGSNYRGGNFYSNLFKLNFPTNLTIRTAIRFDNAMINGYLYRKQRGVDNFEEETYLDMFIFQAGKKQHKPVIGLEDFNESRYLTTKASYNVGKKKIDTWLRKKYKEKSRLLLTEEVYRNRNLDLLDSIGAATNTAHFRKYMLFERNRNMVTVLDSLMQHHSVFTGIGAAHLPGENGVIEMLRNKGYTVTPLSSKQTDYAKSLKSKLESTFIAPTLKVYATKDNFLSIKSFEKLREFNFLNQKYYIATDMANGAYLAITRINTFDYLNKKPITKLKEIDNLLFEDIPGEIIEKTYFDLPYKGIKILNRTKKGDYQKYIIYKTTLEIIIVKLGGKKDYVVTYGDEIFNSISFKPVNNSWVDFTPEYGKYKFSIPSNYITENYELPGKKIVQSYDDKGFYFFEEVPLHDVGYIEEDAFEASYIHKAFLKELKLKKEKGAFVKGNYKAYKSFTEIDSSNHKKLILKSLVKDEIYYLFGYIGKDTTSANTYFNSFKLKDILYREKTKKVIDTSLYFSVKTSSKQPFPYRNYYNRNTTNKKYLETFKKTEYNSKTNENIKITRRRFHDFQMFENIDSVWADIDANYKKDFIISHKNKTKKKDVYSYTFFARDSLSVKQIRVKNIVKKGVLYELQTLEDSLSKSSKFVEDFYTSFSPLDTLLGKDIFVNKVPDFLAALKKNDSIVFSAYPLIKYKNKDATTLIDLLQTHKFPKDKQHIKLYIISKLGELNHSSILPFFKKLYFKSYNNPQTQINILKALIAKKNKESINLMLELLEIDFPVGSGNMATIFDVPKSKDSLKLKRKLFPKLLELATVSEYKKPVYGLLVQLKNKGLIKGKAYKKYKNQIFNDAKLELKRSLFKESSYNNNNNGYNNINTSILDDYVDLLFPFRTEKKINLFLSRLLESNNVEALSTYYALLKKNNEIIPIKLNTIFFKDTENFSVLVDKLEERNVKHNLLRTAEQQQKYAQSKLFSLMYRKATTDSISFIKKEIVKIDKHEVLVYFFKFKRKNEYSNNNELLYYIAFKKGENGLDIKSFSQSLSERNVIDETKTEKELIEESLDKIRYRNRRRVVNGSYNNSYNSLMLDI